MAEDPIRNLKASDESKEILSKIAAEVNAAYRENFEAMLASLQDIAEGQKRLLTTLGILVKAIEPKLAHDVAAAVSIAMPGSRPDIASAMVLADPGAAGYTLSQGELAKQVGLTQADVSILTRAFGLDVDSAYSVRIPQGKKTVVKYRSITGARLRELIAAPPAPLTDIAQGSIKRARATLAKKQESQAALGAAGTE
ncbi:MAG: hypothetical protein MUC96_14440 [Myxococcaceae bacterium]|jgi:hypothetical protein|nr:hypothetical protein [Myxococcaceae bacterium]